MNALITIAGRAGSKGLPGKNIRPFCGKPLVFWSIDHALEFEKKALGYDDVDIIVNSDSLSLLALVNSHYYGLVRTMSRPKELCIDEAGKMDVLRYTLKQSGQHDYYDQVIDLDITNPTRRAFDIRAMAEMQREYEVDSVLSVVPARRSPYFNQVEGMSGASRVSKTLPGNNIPFILRRQDCPTVWDLNCCIYVYDRAWLENEKHIHPLSDNSMIYTMPDYSFCETDTLMDFELAEHMFKKYVLGV
jgi:CMP-N,N'-diacetyllegionaminic acid synthase